jgi:ribosomal protein L16 Arg81 hydroxylase
LFVLAAARRLLIVACDIPRIVGGLIGQMDVKDFNRNVREKRAATFVGAIDPEQLDQLFSLARLEAMLRSETVPVLNVDLFKKGSLMRLVDVQKKSGKSHLAVVSDHFLKGSTIRVRDVDRFDELLGAFVRELQRYFGAHSQLNVYLTPPGERGFPPHFDTTDVFVVQCIGRKEWNIFEAYSNGIDLPLPETDWDPDRFAPSVPPRSITLSAGDVLYLPRGVMHEAFCTDRESMHLTISIVSLTVVDLMVRAFKAAAASDVELRRRVSWSVDSEGNALELEEATRQLRQRIIDVADQVDFGELLMAEKRSVAPEREEPTSSGLLSAMARLQSIQSKRS